MRRVHKGPEPASLKTYREEDQTRSWDDYTGKEDARKAATTEQRQLCAFCQVSIQYRAKPIKLAHVVPQKGSEDGFRLQLIWSNIVGACRGGDNTNRPQIHHCDTLQGNRRLLPTLDPVQFVNGTLTFDWDGKILSPNKDEQKQLDEYLGLNCKPVIRGRLQALEKIEELLKSLETLEEREAERQRLLHLLDPGQHSEEYLYEYADFIFFHLREGRLSA